MGRGSVRGGVEVEGSKITILGMKGGVKGGGFEVCGRQDLDFQFRKQKNYKMKPSKNPLKTIKKQWFFVLKT